jgi:hypothetical protein
MRLYIPTGPNSGYVKDVTPQDIRAAARRLYPEDTMELITAEDFLTQARAITALADTVAQGGPDLPPRIAGYLRTAAESIRTLVHRNQRLAVPEGVLRYLDVSTANLSVPTRERLDAGRAPSSTVVQTQHGWFVHVPALEDGEEPEQMAGCPADLKAVIDKARAGGCAWILFDSDAEPFDDLQTWWD